MMYRISIHTYVCMEIINFVKYGLFSQQILSATIREIVSAYDFV